MRVFCLLQKQQALYLTYMITQELVAFIKQQLQEGKSKEQIANTLVPHGWQLEDINNVFMQIMPTAQPVVPPASMISNPIQMSSSDTLDASAITGSTTSPSTVSSGIIMPSTMAETIQQPRSVKKIVMVAGLVILVLAVLGLGGYYAWTRGMLPESLTGLVHTNNTELPVEQLQKLNTMPQDSSNAISLNETVLADTAQDLNSVMPINNGEMNGGVTTTSVSSSSSSEAQAVINPEFAHVKDAFPVSYPLPAEKEVITATVLSATNFEGIRYVLDYTSTHSLAYLKNAIKASLEKEGYVVSINETSQDYRVIMASKVVRNTARSFRTVLEKTPIGATVHTVFTQ